MRVYIEKTNDIYYLVIDYKIKFIPLRFEILRVVISEWQVVLMPELEYIEKV